MKGACLINNWGIVRVSEVIVRGCRVELRRDRERGRKRERGGEKEREGVRERDGEGEREK